MRDSSGSPPQVRGKRTPIPSGMLWRRITPAGAGKTEVVIADCTSRKDHPRRCGENSQFVLFACDDNGSPPQVRGKLMRCVDLNENEKDHPRRCGENKDMKDLKRAQRGSPPQVRGKQQAHGIFLHGFRITPAGAGKT